MTTAEATVYQEAVGARMATTARSAAQQPSSAIDRELLRLSLNRAAFDHWLDQDEPMPSPSPIAGPRRGTGD